MPHERYTARRIDGAWVVIDRVDDHPVSEHGAGAAGATAAKAHADALNSRSLKATTRPGLQPAELRAWRTAHGLTQTTMARHLGVQPLAVLRWESGSRAIPSLLERALRDLDHELGKV